MASSGLRQFKEYKKADRDRKRTRIINLEENSTMRALNFALLAQTKASQYIWGHGSKRTLLKIGINYGRVLAGVIGYHKP